LNKINRLDAPRKRMKICETRREFPNNFHTDARAIKKRGGWPVRPVRLAI
jgi:hypothetical protein